jgi:hypothetical protein
MTRELANASLYLRELGFSLREEFVSHSKDRMNKLDDIADMIDELESRTCDNCRHFQNKINEEEIACNYHCAFFPLKYKYCGYWESKDNAVENFSKMVHRDD